MTLRTDGWMDGGYNNIPAFSSKSTGIIRNIFQRHCWGWSGGAKVSCILRHWGVQLILAYSLARPAILIAGKGRGGMFLSHLLVAGCDIGVRFSVRPSVRPSVSPSVRPSVRLSTFMSTFDIYVKVSILINYKTKQPSNLA